MDYLGEKLHSVTGESLSRISQLRRNKKQPSDKHTHPASADNANSASQEEVSAQAKATTTNANKPVYGFRPFAANTSSHQPISYQAGPGIPFGGDTFAPSSPPPPPIGFRTDLIDTTLPPPTRGPQRQHSFERQPGADLGPSRDVGASERSLYEGDAWSRLWFQRVMILTLIRLLLFIRKVYEDFQATKHYSVSGATGHILVALATLFLPTVVFTVYRVSRYLQMVLPASRASTGRGAPYPVEPPKQTVSSLKAVTSKKGGARDDDSQLRRSLVGSSSALTKQEDEALVTPRQSPVSADDFQDSKSQQDQVMDGVSPAPSTVVVKDSPQQTESELKESVEIDKLGDIPDKETTRIVIGASEQLLHGALFVFWQLKRQVDVLGYLVERSCLWRKPKEQEREELGRLRMGSDGLEWFQDFYAAFLAILTQVYVLGAFWASNDKQLRASSLNTAATNLNSLSDDSDLSISNSAKAISDVVRNQALAGHTFDGKDLIIISELIVSSAVVFSLLIAVRRRDDGPMTFLLSMLGWGSIFASRIIIIAFAFVHIGWKIMLPVLACHILGITGWIYKISIDSHNGKRSESEESKWDDIEEVENGEDSSRQTIELKSDLAAADKIDGDQSNQVTSEWTFMEHLVLICQIFTLFAIPSLFYWPIMFNLKLHCRPFKYLLIIMSENFILISVIWYSISSTATPGQWYLLCAVCAFSISGFVFVSLYVSCKPSLTEYFARADELFNEVEKSGIYFEFCSRVFKMPDLSKQTFRRLMNQSEQVEEIEVQTN